MFALKQSVKIAHVNARAEIHGEDHKLAVDIKIEAKVSNDMLAEFHSDLKHFLYLKDDAPTELDLGDANRATKLRMPLLGALKWGWEGVGYRLIVEHGISEASYIKLGDCEVDHLRIEQQEGGTVGLTFRVIAHPDEDAIGRLCSLIQQEVPVELMPPEAAAVADAATEKAAKKKAARTKAEEAFATEA